ncbi:MAG TPA: hydroxyisourate hydrolase [Marmoricola sp.]
MSERSAITTHVLDTALGRPASGVPVRLEQVAPDATVLATGTTDGDGRISRLGPDEVGPGTYRLVFDVAAYSAASGQSCFFPEVSITFALADGASPTGAHFHVPLLLSPFAYSTYRGS